MAKVNVFKNLTKGMTSLCIKKKLLSVCRGEDGDFRAFGNTPAWDNACVSPAELL